MNYLPRISFLAVAIISLLTVDQSQVVDAASKKVIKSSEAPIHLSPKYCVSYVNHPKLLGCKSCLRSDVHLIVVDPACCTCGVEVCVSVPVSCCNGAPAVQSRCGILGRRIVRYDFPNGFTVRVVFNRFNKVVVHTYG